MSVKRWSLLAVAFVALYGCAHSMHSRMTAASSFKLCHGAVCNVKVEVDGACAIEVDPEGLLIVKRSGGQDYPKHDVHFNLHGNYKFPANGIEFINTPPNVMTCSLQNDKHFKCENTHTAGAYKYWVRVEGKCNGQDVAPRDPFVMND